MQLKLFLAYRQGSFLISVLGQHVLTCCLRDQHAAVCQLRCTKRATHVRSADLNSLGRRKNIAFGTEGQLPDTALTVSNVQKPAR